MYLSTSIYCRVRLLVNKKTEEAVAVKVVDMAKAKDCIENVKKEVCICKMLSHPNIVRFFGHRSEGTTQYIFLEYCSGGELFDRIGELNLDLDPFIGFFFFFSFGLVSLSRNVNPVGSKCLGQVNVEDSSQNVI